MKECPICHGTCFDDMEVCYGCMHRFAEELEMHTYETEPEEPKASDSAPAESAFEEHETTPQAQDTLKEEEEKDDSDDVQGACVNPFDAAPAVTIQAKSVNGDPVHIVLLAVNNTDSFSIPMPK